jgi:microsomal dipeptidase-like Zn-dependent dipeptidase
MLVDLHSHYPMHLLAEEPKDVTLERMVRFRHRPRWVQKLRAWVLAVAARLLNFRRFSGTWRVDLDGLERGGVRVVLSVLYLPFAEMDLDEWYGSPPESGYYAELLDQITAVERELRDIDPGRRRHVVVKGESDLDDALASDRVAFLHCVEGGFHLGDDPAVVAAHVKQLADRGVTYITLAHLFWRRVATNAPAIPFLSDRLYDALFHQPRGEGLTELGAAAVKAMYRERVLVDLSHMRQDAVEETLALLDELDREHGRDPRDFPVIASHSGFRCGRQAYNLPADTVARIARRDGVVGLIFAQHQLNEGIRRRKTRRLEDSIAVLCRHIDAIRSVTGSHDHVAIGSDLDGFLKPTLGGLESAADLAALRAPLAEHYGEDADKILSANALRVLRKALAPRR